MGSGKDNQQTKKPYSSPTLATYGDFRKLTLGSNSNRKTDVSGRVTKSGS
jgi:hypothetical protein